MAVSEMRLIPTGKITIYPFGINLISETALLTKQVINKGTHMVANNVTIYAHLP